MSDFELVLVALEQKLFDSFEAWFKDMPAVVFHGPFEKLVEFDCMVSPANSFGLMDGGADLAIVKFFGAQLEQTVQHRILHEYRGEQPVGTSMIVETGHAKHPYLAHTPTMRVPMRITRTDHVYLAMWAMLVAVHQHNQHAERPIRIVACPGLGTGTGGMLHHEAARQMALAYRNFLNPPSHISWAYADARQEKIRYGGDMGMTFPPNVKWED